MDFKGHLRRQIGFLERSCNSYDAGYHDEAIRIATVLRVIIHDTKSSISLLKHLNSTTINILSTTDEPKKRTIFFMGMGISRVVVDGKNSYSVYIPQLGDGPISYFVPLSKWWNQIVMVLDGKHRLTRRSIVLAAANKDGGAHVDKKLTEEYEALAKDGATGYLVYKFDSKTVEIPDTNAHMVSLRQMAYEVLNSPALLKICD
jgi:hypothetical protein